MVTWIYKLKIKDVFEKEPEDGDFDAASIQRAPECARRIRALIETVNMASEDVAVNIGNLVYELEDIADTFDEIAEHADDYDQTPMEMFNDNLAYLYDVGDRWHRVWVE